MIYLEMCITLLNPPCKFVHSPANTLAIRLWPAC